MCCSGSPVAGFLGRLWFGDPSLSTLRFCTGGIVMARKSEWFLGLGISAGVVVVLLLLAALATHEQPRSPDDSPPATTPEVVPRDPIFGDVLPPEQLQARENLLDKFPSESSRREILRALERAEARAEREAANQGEKWGRLEAKYKQEVREKYGITDAEITQLLLEALEKGW